MVEYRFEPRQPDSWIMVLSMSLCRICLSKPVLSDRIFCSDGNILYPYYPVQ